MSRLPRSVRASEGLKSGVITKMSIDFSSAVFDAGNGKCPAALLGKFADALIFRITGRVFLKSSIAPISHSELISNSAGQWAPITWVSDHPHPPSEAFRREGFPKRPGNRAAPETEGHFGRFNLRNLDLRRLKPSTAITKP